MMTCTRLKICSLFSRNMLIAPHPENLYQTQVFPGIVWGYNNGQLSGDWSNMQIQQSSLAVAIRQASRNLQSILTVLHSLQQQAFFFSGTVFDLNEFPMPTVKNRWQYIHVLHLFGYRIFVLLFFLFYVCLIHNVTQNERCNSFQ